MRQKEKDRIKIIINKYNDVLLHSMSIAVAEDLINLIVVNGDDKDFQLSDLMKDQKSFKLFVISEFLRINSSSVIDELKAMDDHFSSKILQRKRDKDAQLKLKI